MSADHLVNKAVELWDTGKLAPYEKNAKLHPDAQVKKIAASIKEHGWSQTSKPIEVDTSGVIINGHGRWMAAQLLGMKKVPVVVRDDLTPDQIRKYRLDDNKVAESGFNTELLAEELRFLHAQGMNLEGTFDLRDLEFVLEDLGELNLESIAVNISDQVEKQATDTADALDAHRDVTLGKAFGFGTVTSLQQRKIRLFMAHVEEETSLKGPEALVAFIAEYIGL